MTTAQYLNDALDGGDHSVTLVTASKSELCVSKVRFFNTTLIASPTPTSTTTPTQVGPQASINPEPVACSCRLLTAGQISGIAISAALNAILIGVLILLFLRRRRDKDEQSGSEAQLPSVAMPQPPDSYEKPPVQDPLVPEGPDPERASEGTGNPLEHDPRIPKLPNSDDDDDRASESSTRSSDRTCTKCRKPIRDDYRLECVK